jgi:single-strand DNA-binding protein
MATLNKVMLIGRLTDDPEPARTLPNSGNKVVEFRFAVGRSRKNPQTGQWENDPNQLFIDCKAFNGERRKLADVVEQYLRKGSLVYLEGRLVYEVWDDRQNPGQKRSKHKLIVDQIEFLETRQEAEERAGRSAPARTTAAPAARSNGGGKPASTYDDYDDAPPTGGSGGAEEIPF